jgi:hypothetical protein
MSPWTCTDGESNMHVLLCKRCESVKIIFLKRNKLVQKRGENFVVDLTFCVLLPVWTTAGELIYFKKQQLFYTAISQMLLLPVNWLLWLLEFLANSENCMSIGTLFPHLNFQSGESVY